MLCCHFAPQNLLKSFQPFVDELGVSAQFTPGQFVYNGTNWGCTAPYLPCGDQVMML